MNTLYTPAELTKKQTRLIIRLHERYGIGTCFMASRANTTMSEMMNLCRAGYADEVTSTNTWLYRLTEKCQTVIDANN